MNTINTIAIVGAGALGAAYGSALWTTRPDSVWFLADGERRERLNRDGVVVNDQHFAIPAFHPTKAPTPDLVIVTVKYHQLAEAIELIKPCAGPQTLILSLLNGIDSEEIIAGVFGAQRVIHGMSLGIDAVRHGNRITCANYGTVYFGRPTNEPPAPEIVAIQELFTECGITWNTPADMLRTLWRKFMINVGINQVSAVLDLSYRGFKTNAHARALMEAAMREVIALAEAQNIDLGDEDIQKWYGVIERLAPDGKTSMHQDVEQKRKTEVEMLAGKVIEIGKRLSIPTRVNAVLFDLLRAREIEYLGG